MASIAQPTRSARSGSIANSCAAAMVSSGRSRLPPPIAPCRMASYNRARPSLGGVKSRAKKSSTSAQTRADSASSSLASRSIVSIGIERLEAGGLAVAAEGDLLDARLRVLEASLAVTLEPVAFLIERDRLVERRLALLQRTHYLFEALQRILEAQLAGVCSIGCHGSGSDPHGSPNQGVGIFLNGSRMPGTISSFGASSPASAATS